MIEALRTRLGDHFVAIIGHENEKDNCEAIRSLLIEHQAELENLKSKYQLEKALEILKSKFDEIEPYLNT